jgi:acetyl-CoA C-acetyltransferase
MAEREIVVLSGVRTAIGDYGSALKDVPPSELAAQVIREAVKRAGVDPKQVGAMALGNVIHTEAKDMYISRVAALKAGLPQESTALTVNRLCGSGLQAIVSAAQMITLGDADIAVGGGAESMSRSGYLMPSLRWGQRMGDGGYVAENIATQWQITREAQDAFAVESHRRAVHAIAQGYFKDQILPVELKTRKGITLFDTDEHPRADASLEGMAKLRAAFKKDGSVTAGNASGINDGAAAVVLMEKAAAEKQGLKPLARMVSYGLAGVNPAIMGIGPVPACKLALDRAGLKIGDIDVIEANEAFAVQAMAVACDLNFDPAKTNPNGGAVGLGHPIGATGALLTVKAIYELHRSGGRYALVTMCIGGGQGIAAVFERM